MKKKDQKATREVEDTTHSLHNDHRPTVVAVGQGKDIKIFDLVPSQITFQDLKEWKGHNRPHVRILNPIPTRTELQQATVNQKEDEFHKLYLTSVASSNSNKITSLSKAIKLGADVPKEVEKLLREKEEAQKNGKAELARKIRQQLRKLNYKRFLNKEE